MKFLFLFSLICSFLSSLLGNSFYKNGQGRKIMDRSNFPSEIQNHLNNEILIVLDILKKNHYVGVLEIGSARGTNALTILNNNFLYFGIDINSNFVEQAKRQMFQEGIDSSKYAFELFDFYDLSEHFFIKRNLKKYLVYLPFNLFGNFIDIRLAIKKLLDTKRDFIIATYDTTTAAYEARKKYYQSCGFKDLEYHETVNTSKFYSSDGLDSTAYDVSQVEKIIQEENAKLDNFLKIKKLKYGTFGVLLYIKNNWK
jgi:hypothetical protein